ncbi:hypothetical protein WJX77_007399 [Trebouxia sp. C0004]
MSDPDASARKEAQSRTVENPEFKVSYRTCGPITSCPVQIHWLALCLYHLTLTLDGWSNDRGRTLHP